jgi:hypothetical protein
MTNLITTCKCIFVKYVEDRFFVCIFVFIIFALIFVLLYCKSKVQVQELLYFVLLFHRFVYCSVSFVSGGHEGGSGGYINPSHDYNITVTNL